MTALRNSDLRFMRAALSLARRGYGATSPNPMVGAVLTRSGKIIGRGWHRRAGEPHAEVEALRDAARRHQSVRGATLYVTLEPCSTLGRTPPCTDALIEAGIRRVVVGTTDPNPRHAGRGFTTLRRAGIEVVLLQRARSAAAARLAEDCARLNRAFNHWIVHRTPFVTVKSAMTLDGKIATARGESKWITAERARAYGMTMRQGADAVLVGVNTIVADNPRLTFRSGAGRRAQASHLRRIVLDPSARTPLSSKVAKDKKARMTTVVALAGAPKRKVAALSRRVRVLIAPSIKSKIKNQKSKIDLRWLLRRLGAEGVTHLLVEGGGETNASFLHHRHAHEIVFFYAPKVLGGRAAHKAVAGDDAVRPADVISLERMEWRRLGPDLVLEAEVG